VWIKPGYTPEGMTQTAPPTESGRRLLTLPRSRGAEELRLTLDVFEGHEFLALRLWNRNAHGEWWPTPKGCSIRLHEAGQLARVLAEVAGSQPHPDQAARQPSPRPAAGSGSPPRRDPPEATTGPADFDEFP
jgi:hypothetical protein